MLKLKLTTSNLTLQAEVIELAGDVSDEALRTSAQTKFADEVSDHGVQGVVVSFHRLRPQHVLPQETPHLLPFLPLPAPWAIIKHTGQCDQRWGVYMSQHDVI